MRVNQGRPGSAFFLFVLPALATLACGRDSTAPVAPKTGAIEITVTTTSTIGQVDTANYVVSIDNGAWQPVGVPTRVKIGGLSRANHSITLSGMPTNCFVTSGNPLLVVVNPDLGTLLVTFSVSCSLEGPSPWDY
ncbi:MAG TPA: hypothetical protein VJ865_11775 [Gemmatimonadaceae bacterium]|nr:hypothetical protein [Gemmatimonadaceae bacterium]